MSEHKVFIANGVYPYFRSTATKYRIGTFKARAKYIAGLVEKSGADCATFGEWGRQQCLQLAEFLPDWQYDRAQGKGSTNFTQGINSVWTKPAVWDHPESGISDYNMPSGTQTPPRTLILARITEKADPTAFVQLGAYHETLGNAAGMQYVVAMIARIGERRVLLGGDFKRTDDDDDVAVMKRAGFKFHERVNATPMTCITQGNVTVTNVEHEYDLRAFDHGHLVVTFNIPSAKETL